MRNAIIEDAKSNTSNPNSYYVPDISIREGEEQFIKFNNTQRSLSNENRYKMVYTSQIGRRNLNPKTPKFKSVEKTRQIQPPTIPDQVDEGFTKKSDFFYKLKILQLRGQADSYDVKITDLSQINTPFILYKNTQIDLKGYVIFRPLTEDPITLNPFSEFPWINEVKEI